MNLRIVLIALFILPCCIQAQEVIHRLILIGDAGEINNKQSILIEAAKKLVSPKKTTVYFLGDNIYPAGMGLTQQEQQESAIILQSQFRPFRDMGAPVYFMAGNHDWDHSGKQGLAKIKAQEYYIRAQADNDLRFVPSAGSIGPFIASPTDNIITIIYDSEWWLYPYHRSQSSQIQKQKTDFLNTLDSLKKAYPYKTILVMSHHPMKSYGEHSLRFSIIDHLFPLRKIAKGLYVPLPVVGSIYPLLRSTLFKSAEDLKHPVYRNMIDSITNVLKGHNKVFYISGHDHGLQLIKTDSLTQIVSGSGAKHSSIRKGNALSYGSIKQGFTLFDFLSTGEAKLSFYIVENGQVQKDFETTLVKK